MCVITLWVVERWCMHSQYLSLSVLHFVCVCVCVCVCCQDFGVNNVQHQKLIIVLRYSTVTVIIIIIN